MTARIALAMGLGAIVGAVWGPPAGALGEIAKLVVQMVKTFATPLLFLSVLGSVLNTEIRGRQALRMLAIALFNAAIALSIGLVFANVFKVGVLLKPLFATASTASKADYTTTLDLPKVLGAFVPDSILEPFVENLALPLILLALLIGFATRRIAETDGGQRVKEFSQSVDWWRTVTEKILGWVVQIIPIAVFSAVAAGVGKTGFAAFKGLLGYVALALAALATHLVVTHHGWLIYLRRPIREFWRAAHEPVVYAIGANSSLATLPLTLRGLRRLRVSETASTLGACVGTNFNNDGIILYEGLAALLVAQAVGITVDLPHQIAIGVLSAVAAMGVAGVPEAGFISLALVLSTLGLPTEALPLLLTVDWIVARGRSAVNVSSDMIVSLAIDGRQTRNTTLRNRAMQGL
jgi:DAACS family dicarboxylate/amino acid:cation (Na+ or H+) symporter